MASTPNRLPLLDIQETPQHQVGEKYQRSGETGIRSIYDKYFDEEGTYDNVLADINDFVQTVRERYPDVYDEACQSNSTRNGDFVDLHVAKTIVDDKLVDKIRHFGAYVAVAKALIKAQKAEHREQQNARVLEKKDQELQASRIEVVELKWSNGVTTTSAAKTKTALDFDKYNAFYAKYRDAFRGMKPRDFCQRFSESLFEILKERASSVDDSLVDAPADTVRRLLGVGKKSTRTSKAKQTETHTQVFWTSMFGVAKGLLENGDVMDVIDSSSHYFIGSAKQPDISFTLPDAPHKVLQCVKGVVELKKGGGRRQALKQVIQRRAEIASHRVKFDRLIGATADDTAIMFIDYRVPEPTAPVMNPEDLKSFMRPKTYAEVLFEGDKVGKAGMPLVVHLLASMAAFMALMRHQHSGGESVPRISGMVDNHGSDVVAVISQLPGKPVVTLVKANGHLMIQKEFPSGLDTVFAVERKRIEQLKTLTFLKDVWFTEGDTNIIHFPTAGHRVRINSDEQFAEALKQLQSQLDAIHKTGLQHGDISVRNMIMCVSKPKKDAPPTQLQPAQLNGDLDADVAAIKEALCKPTKGDAAKAGVTYHLIDFGSAEIIAANNFTYTLQSSFPICDGSVVSPAERDCFALRASLLQLAAEGGLFEQHSIEYPSPQAYEDDLYYKTRALFFEAVIKHGTENCRQAAAFCAAVWSAHVNNAPQQSKLQRAKWRR